MNNLYLRDKGFLLGLGLGAMLICSVLGCASLGLRERLGFKKTAQAGIVESRLDSLMRAAIPADTIILAPGAEERSVRSQDSEIWAAPGAVQLVAGGSIPGYRVQLASSENNQELEALSRKVEQDLSVKAYLEKQGNRYCLRIGDFLDREHAEAEKRRVRDFGFKNAWVVQTLVSPVQTEQ